MTRRHSARIPSPATEPTQDARALLAATIARLRFAEISQLFLEVESGNEAAEGLYRSFGAKSVGRRPAYYEHGADAAIFSLAL